MPIYAAPRSSLLPESPDADALHKMKRKLRTVAWQGGLVFLSCGLGGVGIVTGVFDPEGSAAVTSTDPVEFLILGALVVGAVSGLLGTVTALLGSSMVAHWIDRTHEAETTSPT